MADVSDHVTAGRGWVPDDWSDYGQSMRGKQPEALNGFYEAGFDYLQQTLAETPCLAIDIETTGLDSEQDRIVSIGLVEFDCRRIYLASAKHWLVDPGELSDSSVVVHGITHSAVSSAPSIESVMPEVLAAMAGRLAVVHYRAMEREFFRTLSQSLWSESWLFPVMDTFALEATLLTEAKGFFDRLRRKPLPSLRLPDARSRYHLPDYENHNALVDAIATAELLQAQVQHWGLADRRVCDVCL